MTLTYFLFLMTHKWSNQNLPCALRFVTGNLINRIPIFTQPRCCLAFFEVFDNLLNDWPSEVIVYVLMPEHFHLIVNPRDGDIRGFLGALKSLAARRLIDLTNDRRFVLEKPDSQGSIHQVWQDSFKALPLWSGWMIWQKILHSCQSCESWVGRISKGFSLVQLPRFLF